MERRRFIVVIAGDLPVEQPTKFEPVIIKTAKALGRTR